MNLPVETKPALWGMIGGAVAAMIVGFTWGGWVTAGRAETDSRQRVDAAVVQALAPACVARFERDPAAAGNLEALKKSDSWSQGTFIEKGGWAAAAGQKAPDQLSEVARKCASLLTGT